MTLRGSLHDVGERFRAFHMREGDAEMSTKHLQIAGVSIENLLQPPRPPVLTFVGYTHRKLR